MTVDIARVHRWRWKMITKCSFQPALQPSSVEEETSSSAEEGRCAGWKLHLVIIFHRHISILAIYAINFLLFHCFSLWLAWINVLILNLFWTAKVIFNSKKIFFLSSDYQFNLEFIWAPLWFPSIKLLLSLKFLLEQEDAIDKD